jgi:hypothetical protein
MNFIAFSEQEQKEYNDFVDRIPELQQQLLEASQTFRRPVNYHQNIAAREIQKVWRTHRIKKLRKPDPDMAFFGTSQWSWRICEDEFDRFMLIMSQPLEEVQDPFVKRLRMLIKEYDTLLEDKSMLSKNIKNYYSNYIKELESRLRQIITYKLIFEYSKKNSSDEDLLLAYHELQKQKKRISS